MVAYDNVKPSRYPEKPTVVGLLTLSVFLGLLMMFFSLMFYICGFYFLQDDFSNTNNYRQTVVYLQVLQTRT
jgi:vacuolar-type H+-ATPase subunit I/STV1